MGKDLLIIVNIITFILLFKLGTYKFDKRTESEKKEFEQLTKHLLEYSNAEDYVSFINREISSFEIKLKQTISENTFYSNKKTTRMPDNTNATMNSEVFAPFEIIDTMSGEQFEYFIKNILIAKIIKSNSDKSISR